jgi:hypothetical protein
MSIPVGSICVIVQDGDVHDGWVGRECTVVGGLAIRPTRLKGRRVDLLCYAVTVQGEEDQFNAKPAQLRVRRFPPQIDSWLQQKMLDVLKPVDIKESV